MAPAKYGVDVSVDNTFLSPYLQRLIELGADYLPHSTTKILERALGWAGGVLVGTKPEHMERFAFVQKATGGILSPFDSYLLLRGVKTLSGADGEARCEWASRAGFLAKRLTKNRPQYLTGIEDPSSA